MSTHRIGADDRVSETFTQGGSAHYPTETEGVRGFMHLVRHGEAANALYGNAA